MKKSLLIVVDERKMGGVSILLEDMLNLGVFSDYDTDILVLHNNGNRLKNINTNVIYGTKFFNTVDLPVKEVLKTKKLGLIFSKIRLVFEMKTGFIKKRIIKERKKILNKKYDIEIAFKDGFTAIFTAFGDSSKKMHWLHYEYVKTNPNQKYDKLFKKILPQFDQIIAVSVGVKKAFNEIYHLENKVTVVPNIVNVDKIRKLAGDGCVDYNKDVINMVSFGRIHSQKGYDRLIEVFVKLKNEGLDKNIHLTIYGDGPMYNELKERALNEKINISFEGEKDNPYKYAKGADLFILSSRYEPFGLVIVEAQALGIPVLATDNAATFDLIQNNANGMIVNNSVDGLYDGIKKIINNKNLLVNYKRNLKHYNYNIDNIIIKIKEILGGMTDE